MMLEHANVSTVTRRQLPPIDADRLADEIAEVASHIDAATHRLLSLIRRFDEDGGWAVHGALTCAHWLNWRIGLDLGAARERVRVARALASLPVLDDALRRGAVSYAKVRAMTRVATPDNEARLLELARHATGAQLENICRGFRRALANLGERPENLTDEECRRFVRTRDTDDGMVCIEARLRPEEAATLLRELEAAQQRAWRADVSAETRNAPREGDANAPRPALARADALVAVAEAYLAGDSGAAPVELVVHVDQAALLEEAPRCDAVDAPATLDDGTSLSVVTAQRLACDATVVRVAADDSGNVRPLGRRTRRISTSLRRALRVRDDGCRFPGCTNRIADAHHVVAWSHGGSTTLANLCSLCRRHHRFVHEHGYRIERTHDGALRFFRADGSPVPEADMRPAPLPLDTFERLRDLHSAQGLAIDATTAFPRWDGEPADYDLILQGLVLRQDSPCQTSRRSLPAG
jgi:hypothetical protein